MVYACRHYEQTVIGIIIKTLKTTLDFVEANIKELIEIN